MKNRTTFTSENLKICTGVLSLIFFLIAFSPDVSGQSQAGDESVTPYFAVDEMPTYPGGTAALYKFIGSKIIYPHNAQSRGIQGKVVIKFCVTAQGGISQISVLKGIDPDIDNEAVRVVKTIPSFNPGKKDGVAVPVWYMLPITFTIKDN